MKRGCGYCENPDCEDYAKGVFLLNPEEHNPFECPRCREPGFVEAEHGSHWNDEDVFKEVKVYFDYDPRGKRYRQVASVQDNDVQQPCNMYILHSPLIKTENRALKVAEALLANMQHLGKRLDDSEYRSQEIFLCFDDPMPKFREGLAHIESVMQRRADREAAWKKQGSLR